MGLSLLTGWVDLASGRMPFRSVRLFFERLARDERHLQILRILDDASCGDPLVAVRLVVTVEVFSQHGIFAVRDAVFAKVSGLHVRRDDFEIAASETTAAAAEPEPGGLRLLEPLGG